MSDNSVMNQNHFQTTSKATTNKESYHMDGSMDRMGDSSMGSLKECKY